MRAVQVRAPGGLDRLEIVDLPDPGEPGPGEIRIALHATSLNHHDYAVVIGRLPSDDRRIPMADGAGVVEAIGVGVQGLAVGDRVISVFNLDWESGRPLSENYDHVPGDGVDGYAREVVVVPEDHFTLAPAGWTHAEAATLPTAGLTAWRALRDAGTKPGDTVLVLGTGGVAIIGLQMAKAMGCFVAATSSSDAKLDRLRDLGADHLVNYLTDPEWGSTIRELTGGRGVDHVLETSGAGTLSQSFAAVAMQGHVTMIGVLAGRSAPVNFGHLLSRRATLGGVIVGSRDDQRDLVRALEGLDIRPVIDRRFPLEAIADAFTYQDSKKHFGKIVVEW
jgi:NADPH:quinone reductase-like Zn-dependent oxidoreductase